MSGIFKNIKDKEKIKKRYNDLKNLNDFISLLNYTERLSHDFTEDKNYKPLSLKEIYSINRRKTYSTFYINKKNGNNREINSPNDELKRVQNIINIILQIIFEDHSNYHSNGFLINKGILRNANVHVNKNFILNMDIENFFPSINFRRVKTVLELSPFNLKNDLEPISFLIANICIFNDSLPQGAPTSPILSNIITQKLDRKLSKFCSVNNVKYSRYADDLTFSSNKKKFTTYFIENITKIINDENFNVNQNKTRIKNSMERQLVTGLIVNNKVNVKREFLQTTRAMLNNWEKGGFEYAKKTFEEHNKSDKKNNFQEVLLGRLSFIKMIKGKDSIQVQNLILKYFFLKNLINYSWILNQDVKNKLIKDNIKMERLLSHRQTDKQEIFINYCTISFHQIENLLNYYYFRKFPKFENLLETLLFDNPSFKKRYKTLDKAKNNFKSIKDLNINLLVYLYEKEFYFDKGIYYNKEITILREIRNDDSHRCEVIQKDSNELIKSYNDLNIKINSYKKRNKNYNPSNEEQKVINDFKILDFINKRNIKSVRNILIKLNKNIQGTITY